MLLPGGKEVLQWRAHDSPGGAARMAASKNACLRVSNVGMRQVELSPGGPESVLGSRQREEMRTARDSESGGYFLEGKSLGGRGLQHLELWLSLMCCFTTPHSSSKSPSHSDVKSDALEDKTNVRTEHRVPL